MTKVIENNNNDLINVIINAYIIEKKIYESNENNILKHKISANEIIQALRILQLYEKQQNEKN